MREPVNRVWWCVATSIWRNLLRTLVEVRNPLTAIPGLNMALRRRSRLEINYITHLRDIAVWRDVIESQLSQKWTVILS